MAATNRRCLACASCCVLTFRSPCLRLPKFVLLPFPQLWTVVFHLFSWSISMRFQDSESFHVFLDCHGFLPESFMQEQSVGDKYTWRNDNTAAISFVTASKGVHTWHNHNWPRSTRWSWTFWSMTRRFLHPSCKVMLKQCSSIGTSINTWTNCWRVQIALDTTARFWSKMTWL